MCTHDTPEMCETGFLAMAMGAQLDMTPRFSRDGAPLHQMSALGTFSEELVCPEISTVKIDADVPYTSAALIGCGVLTGFGAAANTASIARGDTVEEKLDKLRALLARGTRDDDDIALLSELLSLPSSAACAA